MLEQTPKHAQSDSVTTINTMAGGRANVEAGLQTGLDIVATMAWWDWNAPSVEESSEDMTALGERSGAVIVASISALLVLIGAATFLYLRYNPTEQDES